MFLLLFPDLSHMNGMIRCDLTEEGYPSFPRHRNPRQLTDQNDSS